MACGCERASFEAYAAERQVRAVFEANVVADLAAVDLDHFSVVAPDRERNASVEVLAARFFSKEADNIPLVTMQ